MMELISLGKKSISVKSVIGLSGIGPELEVH